MLPLCSVCCLSFMSGDVDLKSPETAFTKKCTSQNTGILNICLLILIISKVLWINSTVYAAKFKNCTLSIL